MPTFSNPELQNVFNIQNFTDAAVTSTSGQKPAGGSSSSSGSNPDSSSSSSHTNVGAMVGAIIGGLVGVILLSALVLFCIKWQRHAHHRNKVYELPQRGVKTAELQGNAKFVELPGDNVAELSSAGSCDSRKPMDMREIERRKHMVMSQFPGY
jgi:hypothetical protein